MFGCESLRFRTENRLPKAPASGKVRRGAGLVLRVGGDGLRRPDNTDLYFRKRCATCKVQKRHRSEVEYEGLMPNSVGSMSKGLNITK